MTRLRALLRRLRPYGGNLPPAPRGDGPRALLCPCCPPPPVTRAWPNGTTCPLMLWACQVCRTRWVTTPYGTWADTATITTTNH